MYESCPVRTFRNPKESREEKVAWPIFHFQLGADVFIKGVLMTQTPSVPYASPGLSNNRPRAAQLAGSTLISVPKDCLLLTGCLDS